MKLGFLLTNVAALTETWTSTHLIHAALLAGHAVRLLEPWSHEVTDAGRLVARAWALDKPARSREALIEQLKRGRVARRYTELRSLDLLLLRVNPLTSSALQLALLAEELGVAVINHPMGVSLTRTKAWLASLTDVPRPATLVTASTSSAEAFARQRSRQPLVVKPTAASGGRGVTLVPPARRDLLQAALQRARRAGSGHLVLQEYLQEADQGEKRLVWVDGEILGAYLRMRPEGGFRHNLKRGGRPAPCTIDDRDEALCAAISPHLRRNGIRFAGLDVIGGQLVEVNTLNPGGVHWSEALGPGTGGLAERAIALLTRPLASASPPQSPPHKSTAD